MVTSPNKRRLYLAQEGLIDVSTTGIENIIPVIEASAVANHYDTSITDDARHDRLRDLLDVSMAC